MINAVSTYNPLNAFYLYDCLKRARLVDESNASFFRQTSIHNRQPIVVR